MADLPKNIRVGYRDYKVNEMPARISEAEGNAGWHSGHLAEIQVRVEGVTQAEVANTMMHETLHAACAMGALREKFSREDEELIVSVLANQLTQVWRDNPEFVAFMSASLAPPAPRIVAGGPTITQAEADAAVRQFIVDGE